MAAAKEVVLDIETFTDKESQPVGIFHSQVNENTCLQISDKPFSNSRRQTPAYSRLLAISNIYGYVVAGTPKGVSAFMTADAQKELAQGKSKGTNTAVPLAAHSEVDLSSYGKVTHIEITADELQVLVGTLSGQLLVFSASSLLSAKDAANSVQPVKSISAGSEIRDIRANPQEMPNLAAVLTLAGDLLMVDVVSGSTKRIALSTDQITTAICWSRKGKQIVCGDSDGLLKQRLPTDGTVKRTIEPQREDDIIMDEFSVLAVDWVDTYSFFAVYGTFPEGALKSGNGGGGTGEDGEDDGVDDNMTAAYVITKSGKNAAEQRWIYIEDPCSSMMCPTRYPGFHIACLPDWGKSAQNIIVMAGTSSDATMTIGQALASEEEAGADEGPLEWALWDIDGAMAVMPLSAVSNGGSADTFPVGLAMDYTATKDLPPVSEDGDRVPAVPIMWILTTDGCLLGYHIYNTREMRAGGRCSKMVDQVRKLPDAAASSVPASAALSSISSPRSGSPTFASNPFGQPRSSMGGFGVSTSFAPAFGKPSAASPPRGSMGLSAAGIKNQPVFGSSTKLGSSSPTKSAGFGGFGVVGNAASDRKSIFDAPASGPSIFDAPASSSQSLPFGPAKPQLGSIKPSTATNSGFGAGAGAGTGTGTGTGAIQTVQSGTISSKTEAEKKDSRISPPFGSIGKPSADSKEDVGGLMSGFNSMGAFGNKSSGGLFGFAADQKKSDPPASQESKPAASAFGGFDVSATGTAKADPSNATKSVFGTQSPSEPSKSPAEIARQKQQQEEEAKKLKAQKEREEQERKEKERKEKERIEKLRREMEANAQDLLNRQYISTCNRFDGELKALRSSIRDTADAIMHVKSAKLPPIKIDQSVLRMASFEGSLDDLSLDDNDSWNSIANVLLEALNVSRDELQASQKLLNKQMAQYVKTETKREEVGRILETTASAVASSNATIDGGLNPLQRDYQMRLKSSYDAVGKRISDVEEAVNAHADRLERSIRELPHSLRSPSTESIERMVHNLSQTLAQKNYELDEITESVESLKIAKSADYAKAKLRSSATLPYVPPPSMRRASSVSASTATVPRTAAQGTPWSPQDHPFNTTAAAPGRKNRGFGLRAEDLFVGSEAMSPKTPAIAENTKDEPKPVTSPAGTHAHPLFPHVQVRELAPRSSKTNRKASIALDEPVAEDSGASEFSNAALYVQARQQRSMVRDLLTRPTRVAPVVDAKKPSGLEDTGDLSLKITPMPNLERYVEAFSKLKVSRRQPTPEPEPIIEPEPIVEPITAPAARWKCPLCMIDNPPSVRFCLACETENPAAEAPASAVASSASPLPALSFSGGFKPTGGVSLFGSASASTSSSVFGSSTGQPAKPAFTSFVPPPGAPPLSGATKSTGTAAASGSDWKCGTCWITNPPTAKVCRACEEPNPNAITASQPAAAAAVPSATSSAFSGGFKPTISFGAPSSSAMNTGFALSGLGSGFGAPSASASSPETKPKSTMSSFTAPRSPAAAAASTEDDESYDETEEDDDGYSVTESQLEDLESDQSEETGSAVGYAYSEDYIDYSENYETEDTGDDDLDESVHEEGSKIDNESEPDLGSAPDSAANSDVEDNADLDAKEIYDKGVEDKPKEIEAEQKADTEASNEEEEDAAAAQSADSKLKADANEETKTEQRIIEPSVQTSIDEKPDTQAIIKTAETKDQTDPIDKASEPEKEDGQKAGSITERGTVQESEAEDAHDAQLTTSADVKTEAESDAKTEEKSEVEAEAEDEDESKAGADAEAEDVSKAKAGDGPKAEAEDALKTEAEAKAEAEVEDKPKAEAEAEDKSKAKAGDKSDAEFEAEDAPKANVKPEKKSKTETEDEPKTEAEGESKTEAEVEAEDKTKVETKAEEKPKAEAEDEDESKAESEDEPEAEGDDKSDAEVEAEDRPKVEAEVKADDELKAEIDSGSEAAVPDADADSDSNEKADQDIQTVSKSDAEDVSSEPETEQSAEPAIDADHDSELAPESDSDEVSDVEADQVVPSAAEPSADKGLNSDDAQSSGPNLETNQGAETKPELESHAKQESAEEPDQDTQLVSDTDQKEESEPQVEVEAPASRPLQEAEEKGESEVKIGNDTEDNGGDHEHEHEHEHDSDDFVHISQMGSRNESKDDMSIISSHESDPDDDEEEDLSQTETQSSVPDAADNTSVADNAATFDMSAIEHMFRGASVESIVSYAIGDRISDSKATSAADPHVGPVADPVSEPETEPVSEPETEHDSSKSPEIKASEDIDDKEDVNAEEEEGLVQKPAETEASEGFEILSRPESIADAAVFDSQDAALEVDDLAGSFSLSKMVSSLGEEADEDLMLDDISPPPSPTPLRAKGAKQQNNQQLSLAQSESKSDSNKGSVDSSSFFRPGRLGNFSSGLGAFKSSTGAFANIGSQSTSANSSGLPNAFSSVSKTSTSLFEFGAKLDRPAFGVLSMSSKAGLSSSSVKAAGSVGMSFAAKGGSSDGAIYMGSKVDDQVQSKSGLEASERALPDTQFGVYRSRDSSTSGGARSRQSKDHELDPIQRLIHDSDDDHGASSTDLGIDYDSD